MSSAARIPSVLGTISREEFLAKYWQKRPLLIRKAFNPFPDIITPDELAGMCCDDRIESRLIVKKPGKSGWTMDRGPFKPSIFKRLPKKNWTVLVNGADRFVPSVHDILDQFSFIPFWRIDDVMFSYAVDGGNVGAHVDNFDVFLVQAFGTREWSIETTPVHDDDFVPNLPIRLLKKFKPQKTWVLEPGDMLYLPPRFPHHGIARGDDCVTMSVGFRAPKISELVNSFTGSALAGLDDRARYSDPDLREQNPGELTEEVVGKMTEILYDALFVKTSIPDWFGRFVTEPYGDVDLAKHAASVTAAQVKRELKAGASIVRAEGARLAFVRQGKSAITFFSNGHSEPLSGSVAKAAILLASRMRTSASDFAPYMTDTACLRLVSRLISEGTVVIEPK